MSCWAPLSIAITACLGLTACMHADGPPPAPAVIQTTRPDQTTVWTGTPHTGFTTVTRPAIDGPPSTPAGPTTALTTTTVWVTTTSTTPTTVVLTVESDALFATNSDEPEPGVADRLRMEFERFEDCTVVDVLITGHTDTRDTDLHNQRLSTARAESIRRVLINELGFDSALVVAEGRGETEAAADHDLNGDLLEEVARQNRRVEIFVAAVCREDDDEE